MIKFYTSHCPKCNMLLSLMDNKKIKYEIIDDDEIYLPIADRNNIMTMPFAEVNGKIINADELQIYIMVNKGE